MSQNDFSSAIFNKYFNAKFPQYSKNHHSECFLEIDSTNTYAKRILSECGKLRDSFGELTKTGQKYNYSAIIAESQTAGRGRLGRTFYSPSKSGIYLSIIYCPKEPITNPARLTAAAGVAVCRAISALFDVKPTIKWINDIFLNNKKIAGILTEGFINEKKGIVESAIIGIGINIENNADAFPKDVQKIAGSILQKDELSKVSNLELAAEVVGQVISVLNQDHSLVIEEYKKLSFLIGKDLTIFPIIDDEKSSYKARAVDISEEAGLVVELCDGTKKVLNSGEVSLKSSELVL